MDIIEHGPYDPATLKLLGRAFDEVWQEIGDNYSDNAVEHRRTRLALVILGIADGGERDLGRIESVALEMMRRLEKPARFSH